MTRAFPTLSLEQIKQFETCGVRKVFQPGQSLFREGDRDLHFYVILKGELRVEESSSGKVKEVTIHRSREFSGDVDLLTGRPSLVSGVAITPCEVLCVDRTCLREVISGAPELGELLLHAFFTRRELLLEHGFTGIRIVGSRWSSDTFRLISFAARNRVPSTWIDLEHSREMEILLREMRIRPEETPVVLLGSQKILKNPDDAKLAEELHIAEIDCDPLYDLTIVGAGPAGLAAAVYGASEGLKTLLIDSNAPGGQASTSSRIENYLGFPLGISGADLTNRALLQGEKFGVSMVAPRRVQSLKCETTSYGVSFDNGQSIRTRALVIATGVHYQKLPFPNSTRFDNAGVYYGATQTEARFCGGQEIGIIGGGNSAGQAAVFLSAHAKQVHLIVRGTDLSQTMSRYLVHRIECIPNVKVWRKTEVQDFEGVQRLEGVKIQDRHSGQQILLPIKSLFVFIGAKPCTQWLGSHVTYDEKGFIKTGSLLSSEDLEKAGWKLERSPGLLETSLPGVFAAGDVRSGSIKRVATAVGEGATSVQLVHEFLSGMNAIQQSHVSEEEREKAAKRSA
jgi:thioredoxin reductase (NADPH)